VRELNELLLVEHPSWDVFLEGFSRSFTPVEVLPAEVRQSQSCLMQLQVTAQSPLGGIVLNSGGLLLHGGWLRVFGGSNPGGSAGLPGMAEINGFPAKFEPGWAPTGGLLVAHDVLGGAFALNGLDPAAAGRPGAPGEIVYFAPETLSWRAMEMGHDDWLGWILTGRLDSFYERVRWPHWRTDVVELGSRYGFSVFPFLWTGEALLDISLTVRQGVPMGELLEFHVGSCAELGLADPGFLGTYAPPLSRREA
jgi:hypothetical protein